MAALSSPGGWPPFAIPASLWEQMRLDVARRAPQEACGLVGGENGRAREVFPVTNSLHSPSRYRLDPQEQIRIFLLLEARHWQLVAIYHSHPNGPENPSPTDLDEAAYPEAVYLIWSQTQAGWGCRAFRIEPGTKEHPPTYRQVEIDILATE